MEKFDARMIENWLFDAFLLPFQMNDNFGLTLNEFMDAGEAFVSDYDDVYRTVAQAICTTLLTGRDLSYDNPNHPFRAFAEDGTHRDNVYRLAQAIMGQFAAPHYRAERSAVKAFFHSNGSQRDVLEELMDDYYEYVDKTMDEVVIDLTQQQ